MAPSRNTKTMLPLVIVLTISTGRLVQAQALHPAEHYEPSPYHYEYKVHDDKKYLDFGAEEEGDGKGDVHGFYHVQLPDGRLQRVTYTVNDYSGYIADVSYDGKAEHPSHHGSGHHVGGGFGGGYRFGKSLNQEPVQRRPSISVLSDRSGKSLVEERPDERKFSGEFFGSQSQRSQSAVRERSEKAKPISDAKENIFPEPSRLEDKSLSEKPFTIERKPLKRVFKKFDQKKVSKPKSKPFTTFAKADRRDFQTKSTTFGSKNFNQQKQKISNPKPFKSGSPKTLNEFLSSFESQNSSPINPVREQNRATTFNNGSPKTLDEFLNTFESKNSKPVNLEIEQNKPDTFSSGNRFVNFRKPEARSFNFEPETDISSSKSSSQFPRFSSPSLSNTPEVSTSSFGKNSKTPPRRKQKSLIVHRPLPAQ